MNPERLWVRAHGEVRVYVHETWDSILVRGGRLGIEALHETVDALQSRWT